MSTPIFKGLHEIWPDALIDVLVIPETAAVLNNNPYINRVFNFDKRKKLNKLRSFLPLILKLRKNKYDISFSIQSSFTSSLIMLMAGIKNRVGYSRQKLITRKIAIDRSLHIRERVLMLIEDFSDKTFNNETAVFCSELDSRKAKSITVSNGNSKKIAMAPASVWATKKWPENYFVELLKKCGNYSIYLIGGPEDYNLCEAIINQTGLSNIANYAGKLSILESCALIKEMDLLICNDSAPLHMANAVNTNVFAFFGPTVKAFGCYPYRSGNKILELDLDCRPCSKHGGKRCPKGHHNCMLDVKPDFVFKEIESYLNTQQ